MPRRKRENLGSLFHYFRTYKKVKYQGLIYKVGEFVEIYHLGSNFPYVAKLLNIASLVQIDNSQEGQ